MSADLVLRGCAPGDIAIAEGRIAAVGPDLPGGREELDAGGLVALPGVVDAHVHLNEPGRADWEGFATGTAALAAGGTTTCIDMPLNAIPPTVDGAGFDAKVAAASGVARVDVALWGGLVPGDVDRLDELAARGVVGFKAFMSASGVPEFPAADDLTLFDGMARAAALGLPVAVHAESDALTSALAARAVAAGEVTVRDYLASRPVVAELEAIARAILLAEETGCALHVVHVSTGRGVALVAAARARGVDVTCETCPHYLVLGADDAERLGAVAKCAPPLRGQRGPRRALGAARRPRADRQRPLAGAGVAEGRRRPLRDLGRDLGRPDAARAAVGRGHRARAARRAARLRAGAALRAREGDAGRRRRRRRRAGRPARHRGRCRRTRCSTATSSARSRGRTLRGRVVRTLLRGRTIALDGRVDRRALRARSCAVRMR